MVCRLDAVRRTFPGPDGPVQVLDRVDLELEAGHGVHIQGASGSGKTTLLGILGLVDPGYTGAYRLLGDPVEDAPERRRARWRLHRIGQAFQDLHLVPTLTAWENVALPAAAAGLHASAARSRALELLDAAGLRTRAHHRTPVLSGGERRRVAVARALANRPPLLLLDEPLSGLDAHSAAGVHRLVEDALDAGSAVVVTGHGDAWPGLDTLHLDQGRLGPAP